jgi:cellulose biosynthesis protein BcsQ
MENKRLKIVVVSSKGGVGNSTLAMQLVTPYLYQKNGNEPIEYYELDDENRDYLSFGDSQLSYRRELIVDTPIFREELIKLFRSDKSTCIDIGSNKNSSIVIDALDDSGMLNFVDLVVIPLLDGEQDGINATVAYLQLKSCNPNLKFLFVLNRAKSAEYLEFQFENFFGDMRGIFKNQYSIRDNLFDGDKDNFIPFVEDEIIKNSRRFGLSIYEIATQNRDFNRELRENILDLTKEKRVKLLSFKNFVNKSAVNYLENILQPAFKKIDKIIGEVHE